MLFVRRSLLERVWPSEPRGIDASPPMPALAAATGQEEVPATLHKLGNIVPFAWPALRGGEVALQFHEQITRAKIEARVRELAIYARLRLQQLGVQLLTPARPGLWAGILTFRMPGRAAGELAAALARNQRIHLRDLQWPGSTEGVLRASFHVFNSHDDVEKLLRALR